MAIRTYYIWVIDETTGERVRQLVNEEVPDATPAEVNGATLRDRAVAALDANTTFLALASPTNAQTLAQVRVLTRECSALIRLVLSRLDTTEGT